MSRPAPDPWPGSRTAWSLSLGGSDLCLTGELSLPPQLRAEADVSPFTPFASRTQAFCVCWGGLPDSLLLRARLPLSPGRGKNHVAACTAFTLWCRGLETLLHRKMKFCPLNQPLKGKVGVSSQHPLVLSSSESICRWLLMPSQWGPQSFRDLSSAGQEPTEDKPQGPVPQAGSRNKPGWPLCADPSGAFSSHRCLQDGAGDVAFVKETTVVGKGRERSKGTASFALLSFHFIVNPSSELI